jgi:hypothetical protein
MFRFNNPAEAVKMKEELKDVSKCISLITSMRSMDRFRIAL